ncbi:MAG TPA: 2-hydroxychromene-2-carboxylate isomerase [Usitatibacter sp.]|jgi:2-hydroxychromene-2-carboxylate isomerase|nr:2-hydroxychromene-2-carboxylate isomerase [Usitatibacter sp.]
MSESSPVDFYFEFSSPYGYIASQLADALESRIGRALAWRPILLGPVFKMTGGAPLTEIPLKGGYSMRDFERSARWHGVVYRQPPKFPIGTVAALRAFYWTHERDAAQARRLAKSLYSAYFAEGRDIGAPATVLDVAQSAGVDRTALASALEDPGLKERAKGEVESAIARGVFGSPFFIVDGEPFWGVDRIPMLEEWLRRGGW